MNTARNIQTRDLRAEARALMHKGEYVALRGNSGSDLWYAWDCYYRSPIASRGEVRFTLIHRIGTAFID